jgi:hypothetical protein
MIMRRTSLRTAALLLAFTVAGCVKPVPPAAPLRTEAAPVPPASPALPAERLDLPLRAAGVTWQAVGGGSLPSGGDMQEYVPAGQTIADWSEMITTLTLPAGQDPSERLAAILDGLRGACKSYRVIKTSVQDGPYPSRSLLARCDQPDATAFSDPNILLLKHEVIWAKTLEGHAQNYVVWRAWHGDKVTADSVLTSAATRQQWQDWVDQVSLAQGG